MRSRKPTPPRPPGHHGHWLLNIRQQVAHPLELLIESQQRHGDVVFFNTIRGPIYVLSHPDHAQRVFVDNARNFRSLEGTQNRLIGNGLFGSHGEFWRRQRRMVQPAFHRTRLARMVEGMVRGSETLAERWREKALTGEPLELLEQMRQLVASLLSVSIFSRDLYANDPRFRGYIDFFTDSSHGKGRDSLWKAALRRMGLPRSRRKRYFDTVNALDDAFYELIAERRRQPRGEDDILTVLLEARDAQGQGMTDLEVRDELVSLQIGGHESTSVAFTWTWYMIASHPEVEQRMRDELSTVLGGRPVDAELLQALHYTRAVVKETLRLRPPAWRLLRRVAEDEEIDGWTVPAGSLVQISPYLLHRHRDFWEQPERFLPERFLPEQGERQHRYAYMPFGAGQRMCVGNAYTVNLIMTGLATLLRHFQVRLVPDHPVVPLSIGTHRPRDGVMATLHPAPSASPVSSSSKALP